MDFGVFIFFLFLIVFGILLTKPKQDETSRYVYLDDGITVKDVTDPTYKEEAWEVEGK